MQFKRVKKRIHILVCRGKDPIKKRSIVKMVGRLDEQLKPSPGLINSLSIDEKVDLFKFIAEETDRREIELSLEAAKNAPDLIDQAVSGIKNGFKPTAEWRRRVVRAIDDLASLIG